MASLRWQCPHDTDCRADLPNPWSVAPVLSQDARRRLPAPDGNCHANLQYISAVNLISRWMTLGKQGRQSQRADRTPRCELSTPLDTPRPPTVSRHAGSSIAGTTVSKPLKAKASNSQAGGTREMLCCTKMAGTVFAAQTNADLKQQPPVIERSLYKTLRNLTGHLPKDWRSQSDFRSGWDVLKAHLKVRGCLHCRVFHRPRPFFKRRICPSRKAS